MHRVCASAYASATISLPSLTARFRSNRATKPPNESLFVHEVSLRIPTQGGQVFQFDRGHCSDLMAATIPI
jgi:hypothetical protein